MRVDFSELRSETFLTALTVCIMVGEGTIVLMRYDG
jgi:hypothetical protein